MNHEAASGKLLELVYGELTPGDARAVEAHVAGCEACRAELAGIRDTRALMALLPVDPAPSRGEGIVLAAAREAADARRPRPLLPRWLWAGTAGAMAAAVVAVVSWQLVRTAPGGQNAERESELLGRAPPAQLAAKPATTPPPAEGPRAGELAATPAPTVAKRAAEPAPPKAQPLPGLQREQACERMAGDVGVGGVAGAGAASGAGGQAAKDDKGSGWVALGGAKKEERAPPPPATSAPARESSTRWRAAAPEAQSVADAVAPSAPMAAPAPAPAPAARPAGGAAAPAARAKAAASLERKVAAPMALRDEAEAAPAAEKERAAAAPEAGRAAALRAEVGAGSVETRSFAECAGERSRIVQRDAEGRVVRYVRLLADSRRIEQRYGPDGRLSSAAIIDGKVARPLPLDTPWLVRDARDAGIDAPPRCGQVPAVP